MNTPVTVRYPVERLMECVAVPFTLDGTSKGTRSVNEFAAWLGVDTTVVGRAMKAGGFSLAQADRFASRLGWHPAEVWAEYGHLEDTDQADIEVWATHRTEAA